MHACCHEVRSVRSDIRMQDGSTPLFAAAMNGHVEVVKHLSARAGKDKGSQVSFGCIYACMYVNITCTVHIHELTSYVHTMNGWGATLWAARSARARAGAFLTGPNHSAGGGLPPR